MKIFKYRKNNNRYQNKTKLYHQVMIKVLPITKALYPSYFLPFLFDNTTSYFVYIKDMFQVKEINTNIKSK